MKTEYVDRIMHNLYLLYRQMRRPDVSWLTRADDAILSFLENHPSKPLIATPAVVEANTGYAASTIRARMRLLEAAGLLQYYDEDRAMYELSQLGQGYLDATVDQDELEAVKPE